MNDYKNFCEYVVRPQASAGVKAAKVLLVTGYTIFTLLYLWIFGLNFRSWAMCILLPFILFAIIRVSWRYTSVEYEYTIEAGELAVAAIYSGAARRTRIRMQVPEMTVIAPYNEQSARWTEAPDIVGTMIFADPDSPDAYLCVAPDPSKGKKRAVVIETNEEKRRILRLCNPAAFRK